MKPSLPALLALLPLLAAGCIGKECNLMYAPDALEIDFSPALTGDGAWSVTLSGDLDAACTVSLPLADDGAPDCDTEGVELVLSDDGSAIEAISLFGLAPEHLTLDVALEGATILSEDLTPTYTVDEPNGEGCGERQSAVVVVDTAG